MAHLRLSLKRRSNTKRFTPWFGAVVRANGPRLFLLGSEFLLDRFEREEEAVPSLHAGLELEFLSRQVAFHFSEATSVFLEKHAESFLVIATQGVGKRAASRQQAITEITDDFPSGEIAVEDEKRACRARDAQGDPR